jgi:alkanesulfonate monooxygenase SsuD/methylene tetrahydromethanopterin reductase-like flavin-dependent oxidoreductase (luciferase family)
VHEWFAFHGKAPSYEAMIEREGVGSASDIAIVGTEDDVRRRILALAEIGVTDLVAGEVLAPGETDTLRTRALLAELARGRVSAT